MADHTQDQLFKQIAKQYIEQDAKMLRQELRQLEKENISYLTPKLDRQVNELTAKKSTRKRYLRIVGLMAACLLVAIITPQILKLHAPGNSMSDSTGQSSSQEPNYSAEPAPDYAVIPLSFTLPQNLSISNVEQDIEKTIYHLEDIYQDPVVLTLRQDRFGDYETKGLVKISIHGKTVYGYATPDYQLITFKKDGIVYEMTCVYDINTLVELSEGILI